MPMETETLVKGHTIRGRLKYLEAQSAPRRDEVLENLGTALRGEISKGILPIRWYPFAYLEEIVSVSDRVLGGGDLRVAREIGRTAAHYSLGGMFKFFLKLGSVEFTFRQAQHLWQIHVSCGTLIPEFVHPGHLVMRLENFPAPQSHAYCANLEGWVGGALECTGVKSPQTRHRGCWHDSSRTCLEIEADY